MTDPDPDDAPIITVPASATRAAETTRPAEPAPAAGGLGGNGRAGSSVPRPAQRRAVVATGSRFVVLHPHVSFFSWLADLQGSADASPEERLQRYRSSSPWLFKVCVVLDLLVLFVVTGILVVALAAVLFKAIFGVV